MPIQQRRRTHNQTDVDFWRRRLAEVRLGAGDHAASVLGISQDTLRAALSGQGIERNSKKTGKIAKVLGCCIDDLFAATPEETRQRIARAHYGPPPGDAPTPAFRPAVADRVVTGLKAGRPQLVIGGPFSGKTTLAQYVIATLKDEYERGVYYVCDQGDEVDRALADMLVRSSLFLNVNGRSASECRVEALKLFEGPFFARPRLLVVDGAGPMSDDFRDKYFLPWGRMRDGSVSVLFLSRQKELGEYVHESNWDVSTLDTLGDEEVWAILEASLGKALTSDANPLIWGISGSPQALQYALATLREAIAATSREFLEMAEKIAAHVSQDVVGKLPYGQKGLFTQIAELGATGVPMTWLRAYSPLVDLNVHLRRLVTSGYVTREVVGLSEQVSIRPEVPCPPSDHNALVDTGTQVAKTQGYFANVPAEQTQWLRCLQAAEMTDAAVLRTLCHKVLPPLALSESDEVQRLLGAAAENARTAGDARIAADLDYWRGMHHVWPTGGFADALPLMEMAADEYRAVGDRQMATTAVLQTGICLASTRQFAEARQKFTLAKEMSESDSVDPLFRAQITNVSAITQTLTGAWRTAAKLFRESESEIRAAEGSGTSDATARARHLLALNVAVLRWRQSGRLPKTFVPAVHAAYADYPAAAPVRGYLLATAIAAGVLLDGRDLDSQRRRLADHWQHLVELIADPKQALGASALFALGEVAYYRNVASGRSRAGQDAVVAHDTAVSDTAYSWQRLPMWGAERWSYLFVVSPFRRVYSPAFLDHAREVVATSRGEAAAIRIVTELDGLRSRLSRASGASTSVNHKKRPR